MVAEDAAAGKGSISSAAEAEHRKKWNWKLWKRGPPVSTSYRIDKTVDNSLEASKHILELCREMNELGVEVISALEIHLEKLDNIERMLESINESIHEAEEDLGQMEKCCGLITLPWKRAPDYEETDDYRETWMKAPDPSEFVNIVGPPEFLNNVACKHPGPPPKGPFFDSIIPSDPREGEIEANLEEASNLLISIRKKVVDIAAELEFQERSLPDVAQKASSLEHRVKLDTERANVILKSEEEKT